MGRDAITASRWIREKREMTDLANERVVYINGEIVPESRAMVSFRDRSFKYGDGAFDMTRTFKHRIFKRRKAC